MGFVAIALPMLVGCFAQRGPQGPSGRPLLIWEPLHVGDQVRVARLSGLVAGVGSITGVVDEATDSTLVLLASEHAIIDTTGLLLTGTIGRPLRVVLVWRDVATISIPHAVAEVRGIPHDDVHDSRIPDARRVTGIAAGVIGYGCAAGVMLHAASTRVVKNVAAALLLAPLTGLACAFIVGAVGESAVKRIADEAGPADASRWVAIPGAREQLIFGRRR